MIINLRSANITGDEDIIAHIQNMTSWLAISAMPSIYLSDIRTNLMTIDIASATPPPRVGKSVLKE